MKTKKNILYSAASTLIVAALCSCGSKTKVPITETVKSIETVKVDYTKSTKAITLPGELQPFNQTDIYANVNGFVKEVLVDRGSIVKKGDLLAIIDAPEIEAQMAEASSKMYAAEAVYQASKANYLRLIQTSKTPGTVSPNDLDLSKSKMLADSSANASAKANYQATADIESYLKVTAAFDGVITERNISPGALVGPASKNKDIPLLKLKQEDKLRLTVALPEMYSGSLPAQQKIMFKVKSYPDSEFPAFLARKAESISPEIRSEMIEFDVDNKSKKLKSGMYSEVTLNIEREDSTILLPKSAVVTSTERVFVIRVNNKNEAEWIDVKKGNAVGDKIEVWGLLQKGDNIILAASEQIRNGQKL